MIVLLALSLLLAAGREGDGFREDFERPVLEGWERISSDLHPPYNTVELVRDPRGAKSGDQFVRFQSQGGFTGLTRPASEAWPVEATRAYRLTAFARLEGTRGDGASLSLTWYTNDGSVISVTRSDPVRQTGAWILLTLEIAQVPEGAASASPGLEFGGDDVRGQCDFDQLALVPTAFIELGAAGRTAAVFDPGESPRFWVTLKGAPPGTHRLSLVLTRGEDPPVRRSVTLTPPAEAKIEVAFPPLSPGAHELVASVEGEDGGHRLPVLVPNPWISAIETTSPAVVGGTLSPAPPSDLLSMAKVSVIPGPAGASNGTLELALRRRISEPESPVTIDRLFINARGEPTPAFLALRAANDLLAGAVPMSPTELFPPEVRVAAFRKGDTAALALWSETGTFDLAVSLNPGAQVYPPLGAVRRLRAGESLHLDGMPVFLLNVDPLFLELAPSLSGAVLPLQIEPSTCVFGLRNPSTRALGDVEVSFGDLPAGWRIAPRTLRFPSLAPRAAVSEELHLQVPPSETERSQSLGIDLRFTHGGQAHEFHFVRVLKLRAALRIETDVHPGPTPGARGVSVRIQNATDRTVRLTVRVRLPGLPEQMELIRELAPGATSAAFEYRLRDVLLLDPAHLTGEVEVLEPTGVRAVTRQRINLR